MNRIPLLDLSAMTRECQEAIDAAWRNVTSENAFIGGRYVSEFEGNWAAYCKTEHCIGVGDGTAALELSLRAIGVGPGDDVLVPANTFIATWQAVVAVGANPVPVDVDPDTLLITKATLQRALTPNTVGVMPVHLYGQPVNMTDVMDFADQHRLWVVEDAAQAHGAKWKGKPVGSFGVAGCFSFYPGKNFGAFGDAGAVVTNDAALASHIRSLTNYGRREGQVDVHHVMAGNRRLDGLQAAILSAKLPLLDSWNQRRRDAHGLYAKHLADAPLKMVKTSSDAECVHHLEVVQIDNRDEVRRELDQKGIMTGLHYRHPCHLQPALRHRTWPEMPIAEAAADRIVSLPMNPHLTSESVKTVCATLSEILLRNERLSAAGRKHAAE